MPYIYKITRKEDSIDVYVGSCKDNKGVGFKISYSHRGQGKLMEIEKKKLGKIKFFEKYDILLVEYCELSALYDRESYYTNYLQTFFHNGGFNIQDGAKSSLKGMTNRFTDDQLYRMSENTKGEKHPFYNKKRKWTKVEYKGEIYRSWYSLYKTHFNHISWTWFSKIRKKNHELFKIL